MFNAFNLDPASSFYFSAYKYQNLQKRRYIWKRNFHPILLLAAAEYFAKKINDNCIDQKGVFFERERSEGMNRGGGVSDDISWILKPRARAAMLIKT